jgi:signal transduction histidine kinase
MGLRISRAIVESHGGRLWAGDHSPRGARFAFTLPVKIEGGYEARRRYSSYIPKYDGTTTNG